MLDKKVTKCKCGAPIGKRIDSRKIETLRYFKGNNLKNTLVYSGDIFNVICGNCGITTIFSISKIPLSMTYVIK